jgi:1-pyrroline-5-carboxylate dehydrogenase
MVTRRATKKVPVKRKAAAKKVAARRTAPKKPALQKITYATLAMPADDPRHDLFDQAVADVKANLSKSHPLVIGGEQRVAAEQFADVSPVNTDWTLGYFQKGTIQDARDAIAAARKAFPVWRDMGWKQRVKIMRKAADLISKRNFQISAIMTLEVGKNRTEALGDVEETADLIRYYCDRMEEHKGFVTPMGRESSRHHNTSYLKPYGVWVVISPFNFPFALAGGPSGAALVAGNAVVFKPATDTPYVGLKLTECFLEAGVPEGAFNFVTGPGSTVGEELVTHPDVDGITFTGSYDIGMHIYRTFPQSKCTYPRPCIIEMGGKNPAVISRHADLDVAAMGVMRSAFGLQGQKCSAASRVYVERPVADAFLEKLIALTDKIAIGDPSQRDVWFGPVVNKKAYTDYVRYCEELAQSSKIVWGGKHLAEGKLGKGYFCAPTISVGLPTDHHLWQEEMFLPIVTVAMVDNLDEAMRLANDVCYGLTAGFYSDDPAEIQWFFDHIQAGVTYVNRMAGATTGAWPGYQPFGGWKGSGSTGKCGGGLYYVQQYLHEQSQTLIDL